MEDQSIKQAFEKVKKDMGELKERVSKLESQKSLTKSQQVSTSLNKSHNNLIETKIINKLRRSKKKAVILEIEKLLPSTSIPDIKIILVDEKGLCSKPSFYRYIKSLSLRKVSMESQKSLNGVSE